MSYYHTGARGCVVPPHDAPRRGRARRRRVRAPRERRAAGRPRRSRGAGGGRGRGASARVLLAPRPPTRADGSSAQPCALLPPAAALTPTARGAPARGVPARGAWLQAGRFLRRRVLQTLLACLCLRGARACVRARRPLCIRRGPSGGRECHARPRPIVSRGAQPPLEGLRRVLTFPLRARARGALCPPSADASAALLSVRRRGAQYVGLLVCVGRMSPGGRACASCGGGPTTAARSGLRCGW